MTRVRFSAPVDPNDRFAQQIKALQEQVAELQRAASRPRTRILYYGVGSASSWTNATTTLSDITASTGSAPAATLALRTDRYHRVKFRIPLYSSVADDQAVFQLVENGTVLSERAISPLLGGASNRPVTCTFETEFIPASSAAVVYKMQGRRTSASTGTLNAGGVLLQQPIVFIVEDIGPA